MFKKEITLFIYSDQIKVYEISKIDVIVGGDHGQDDFRLPIKLLFIMKSKKMLNVQVVLLTFYAKKILVIYSRIP